MVLKVLPAWAPVMQQIMLGPAQYTLSSYCLWGIMLLHIHVWKFAVLYMHLL